MNVSIIAVKGLNLVKKYSPEILLGLGIVGTGAAVYKTYKAAPVVNNILTNYNAEKENYETARQDLEDGKITAETFATVEVPDKKLMVKEIASEVFIPTLLAAGSIFCFVKGYSIQRNRILGLSGALATTMRDYKEFKERVKTEIGEKKYKELLQPVKDKEMVITDEKGKEKKVVDKVALNKSLMDGFWFSESDEYAADNHEYNMQYVDSVISQLDLVVFNKNGLIMNEALEAFGMSKTRQGALLGWDGDSNLIIEKEIYYIMNEETGVREPQIYIHWSTPKYIYEDVSYDTAYYLK